VGSSGGGVTGTASQRSSLAAMRCFVVPGSAACPAFFTPTGADTAGSSMPSRLGEARFSTRQGRDRLGSTQGCGWHSAALGDDSLPDGSRRRWAQSVCSGRRCDKQEFGS